MGQVEWVLHVDGGVDDLRRFELIGEIPEGSRLQIAPCDCDPIDPTFPDDRILRPFRAYGEVVGSGDYRLVWSGPIRPPVCACPEGYALTMQFQVSGTQSRPAGLPMFVFGHNNLNPRVEATQQGLIVKVVQTNILPWSSIRSARRQDALRSKVLVVVSGGWEYLLHFHDPAERERLAATLAQAGVAVS